LRLGESIGPSAAPILLQVMSTLSDPWLLCDSDRIVAPSVSRTGRFTRPCRVPDSQETKVAFSI
jgi:hypothetical protein